MIPKKIHYCWFGGQPLSEMAQRCIESWKKYLPEYEIICWNENNFDVNRCDYTREAYQYKKWAFVSDYARFVILYKYGGIYFDTDVEVIQAMNDLIEKGSFMGCEQNASSMGNFPVVAPGLGLAASPGLDIYKEIIEDYEKSHFIDNNGVLNMQDTVVTRVTRILVKHGLHISEKVQKIDDIYIYPKEYFSPKDVLTQELVITENTRSIHHYDASWAEWYDKRAGIRGIILRKYFGKKIGDRLNVIIYVLQKYGCIGCIKKIFLK